ncbi:uncharacterized protein LOC118511469 [Anopheles stephensi]|uniref:uncharacterized protein LOC118511469 n=1 Tax=Anopheles stephensi TaxID=30069 RepID=UPI0007D287A5|nr:uncharacterized protein LOC118511469 [Anopheles stephensi]
MLHTASVFLALVFTVTIAITVWGADVDKVVFQFPEYDFKETSKNELTFREYESACDQSNRCAEFDGIERTRCVRECISPSCYQEIYKFDELEEGEIDVRLNSFRACFMQRLNRNRG